MSLAADASVIRIAGFSSAELSSLSADGWRDVVTLRVAGSAPDAPPVTGAYRVAGGALEFVPRFPLDPGRAYDVRVDPSKLPVPRAGAPVGAVVSRPAVARAPSTTVVRMLPSADVLPENLLRIYLEFSAPMSSENGRAFLTLVDDRGKEVVDAFLALDVDFWSADHRRYTVFFDPGRVKRGILPNDQMGRALKAGQRFTLVVDPRWRDGNGLPLAAEFRRTFTAGPADLKGLQLADWRVDAPPSATRHPLRVVFPGPLDHGVLQRAVGVQGADGQAIPGEIVIGVNEREWRFTPRDPWTPGRYEVVVFASLEDPAGNRIGRAFDIDTFERKDPLNGQAPERFTLPFVVR